MHGIPGIVEKGAIKLIHPITAEDGTSVLVFVMPKPAATDSNETLFGKWTWYTDEIEREVQNGWQRWAEKAASL